MRQRAVCYTATSGYLFSTVLSALQARAHTDAATVSVVVCLIADAPSEEQDVFQSVCDQNGIDFVLVPVSVLRGLHPTYARLFLDEMLPGEVEEILYLDGDTQVLAALAPLLEAQPPAGGVLAVRDPMVFLRQISPSLRRKIDGWWDESEIPDVLRTNYVNAGVMRISRPVVPELREGVLDLIQAQGRMLHFKDQDAINLVLGTKIAPVSLAWNFPGFLLGSRLESAVTPRIIHFMSDPRPWDGPLPPWGAKHHKPYLDLTRQYPATAPYRTRLTGSRRVKYELQQRYKGVTEGRLWQRGPATDAVVALEQLTPDLG
jgi:lipopolysaccharide biosynthesis glycosyltransferase